jgi:histidine triad (HIT) family protein
MDVDCIFCQIISGSSNAAIVYQDEVVTAFLDAHPIAPTHILIVPNQHIGSLNDSQAEHDPMLGRLVTVARQLASQSNIFQIGRAHV